MYTYIFIYLFIYIHIAEARADIGTRNKRELTIYQVHVLNICIWPMGAKALQRSVLALKHNAAERNRRCPEQLYFPITPQQLRSPGPAKGHFCGKLEITGKSKFWYKIVLWQNHINITKRSCEIIPKT